MAAFPASLSVVNAIEFFAVLGFQGWLLPSVGIPPALMHDGENTYISIGPTY